MQLNDSTWLWLTLFYALVLFHYLINILFILQLLSKYLLNCHLCFIYLQVILKAVPSSSRIQAVLLNVSSSENSVSMIPPMEALAQLQLDVERFVEALRRCLLCIHSFFSQRGLDPVFPPESKKQ